MGLRQRQWARRKRRMWTEIFGGVCAHCGHDGMTKSGRPSKKNYLTFDIKDPTLINGHGDDHHKKGMSERMCFYHKQIALGNVQLLCKNCNDKKGNTIEDDDDTDQPF